MSFRPWRLRRTLVKGADHNRSARELSEKIRLGSAEKQLSCARIREDILPFAAVSDIELKFRIPTNASLQKRQRL